MKTNLSVHTNPTLVYHEIHLLILLTKVIVVDDDTDTVDVCKEVLETKGITVVGIGHNGKEAVMLYEKHLPDVAFLDVMMPDYDGIFALEIIRKKYPESKIIMATADKTYDTRKSLERLDPNGIIYKPYDIDEMFDVMSKVLTGQKIYAPF
jgi:two-component system, chemotaxis family, chemotaxis protein CheY